jgi:hypothetical protein
MPVLEAISASSVSKIIAAVPANGSDDRILVDKL